MLGRSCKFGVPASLPQPQEKESKRFRNHVSWSRASPVPRLAAHRRTPLTPGERTAELFHKNVGILKVDSHFVTW